MEQPATRPLPATLAQPPGRRGHLVVDPTHPAALGLLGEVLARLPGVERPVVQIIATSHHASASQVALELAIASARQFGTTLLVAPGECAKPDMSGARELSWRMTQMLGGSQDGVLPDAVIAGLYHCQLPESGFASGVPPIGLWQASPRNYRMIVIDAPCISANPRGLASAQSCSGCVLSVAAGATRQSSLLALQRQFSSAGVPILGTVLFDAKPIRLRLPWSRRAA